MHLIDVRATEASGARKWKKQWHVGEEQRSFLLMSSRWTVLDCEAARIDPEEKLMRSRVQSMRVLHQRRGVSFCQSMCS